MSVTGHALVTLCLVLTVTSNAYVFDKKALKERRCDPNSLAGYGSCVCDYALISEEVVGRPEYQLRWVNCTDRAFGDPDSVGHLRQLSNMLENNGYTELEALIYVGNTMPELPVNLVGRTSLENLAYLDLSRNHIHTIRGKTFHSMPDLTELYLDNNDWFVDESSPRVFSSIFNLEVLSLNNAFTATQPYNTSISHTTRLSKVFEGSKLDYLRELYLENNNLYTVDSYVFQNLISLEKISLAHNHINNLRGVFNSTCFASDYVADYMGADHKCALTSLDLSHNSITTVPRELLSELGNLNDFTTLYLQGNPFLCDCRMLDFYDWLKEDVDTNRYTVSDHTSLVCQNPPELRGRPIVSLDREEMVCVSSQWDERHSSHTAAIVIGILFAVIGVGLMVAVYMNWPTVAAKSWAAWSTAREWLPNTKVGYNKVEEPEKVPVSV